VVYNIQGQVVSGGGCRWSQAETASPAETGVPMEIREIAVIPETCLAQVEEGQTPAQYVEPLPPDLTNSVSAALTSKLSLADIESVWFDVASIALTDVHSYLSWHWNGTCVTSHSRSVTTD
jgi:hypothetical protein